LIYFYLSNWSSSKAILYFNSFWVNSICL